MSSIICIPQATVLLIARVIKPKSDPSVGRKRPIFGSLLKVALVAVLASIVTPTLAAYPDKLIRLMVPWPPGGSSDSAARLVANHLQDRLGQTVLIDNKPGASGNIGTAEVSRAKPDGYTLLLSSGPFSINPSLYRKLPFDTLRDFTPISQIAIIPSVLVVNSSFPAQTIHEFVALAKDKSQSISYASPGSGSAQHLAMELLRQKADLSLTHIPYKGGALALNDLLGGHVPVMLSGIPEVMPHLQSGKLRVLAVTTATRTHFLPDVPTLMEVGLADTEMVGWNGLHAPAGTPEEIVERLSREVREILKQPNVREKLTGLGFEIQGSSPQEFGQFFSKQMELYRDAVRISGASLD
jgi:tripartite-type tricarboxylate transporter receptor subunit TctC